MRPQALAIVFLLFASLAFARGGGGCFLPGTLVATQQGEIPIEKVEVGQSVLSFDGNQTAQSEVSEIYQVERDYYYSIAAGGKTVRATAEHPFYIGDGKFIDASALKQGDTVYLFSDGQIEESSVDSVSRIDGKTIAYNLQAEPTHTFFADGFAVHNKGGCFAAGTLVLTPDGARRIETIKPGDSVYSFSEKGITVSRVGVAYEVSSQGFFEINAGGYSVLATSNHPFLTSEGYRQASELAAGDVIYMHSEFGLIAAQIDTVTYLQSPSVAYNLEVEGSHTFFANNFAVHNKGGCFEGSTQIACVNGSMKISDLQPGDIILSFDKKGATTQSQVTEKYSLNTSEYYEITTESSAVNVTPEHPFLVPGGFAEASTLSVGDIVYSLSENGALNEERVVSKTLFSQPLEVYNLQVGGEHTFFANTLAVHNKGGGGGGGGSHSSGPPPNVFYYDCNKRYKDGEELKQCCGQTSSKYVAGVTAAFASTVAYPYCDCVSSKCHCSNVASYFYSKQNIPSCPFDLAAFLLAVLMFAVPLAIFYFASRIFPKHSSLIIALAFVFFIGEMIVLNPMGSNTMCIPISVITIFIFAALSKGKLSSFSGSGEWSSTASAPSDKVKAKAGKVSALLAFWSKIDSAWDEAELKKRATATFLKLQDCWGRREYAEMEPLLSPSLYAQHTSQLEAMAARHELNRMDNLKILDLQIVLARRFEKKEKDEFTAWFKATACDTIADDRTGKKIRGDSGMGVFEEFWTFSREGNGWRLREIDQPEEGMHVIGEESFDEGATPLMMKTLQERATTGKTDTSVSAIREQGGEIGAPAIGEIKEKGDKIHRMLNFLSQTDRIWDERAMLENARTLFILLNTAVEKRNLGKVQDKLSPELHQTIQENLDEMKQKGMVAQKGNLAVRNVEIVLVNNLNDRQKDEFVAWISAQAQNVLVNEKTGKTVSGGSFVHDFEEYWTFRRSGSEWKLAEISTSMKGKEFVASENVDEGTSKDMLQWYYSKERAL